MTDVEKQGLAPIQHKTVTIRAVPTRLLIAVLASFVLTGCNQTQATSAIDKLAPCEGTDTPAGTEPGTSDQGPANAPPATQGPDTGRRIEGNTPPRRKG